MNDLNVYSQKTLASLRRAFVVNRADFIIVHFSKDTPKWVFDDVSELLKNGDAVEKDCSEPQETISEIRLTPSFKKLLMGH